MEATSGIKRDRDLSENTLCILSGTEKRFGRNASPVLGPLSMKVYAGEILGIRGGNGAGKSTLLSVMAGALKPDRGTVKLSERALEATGYVPQELSLYESLSAYDNLKFYGMAEGLPMKAMKIRSEWLLKRLELSDKAREKVRALSGGMKRRLHLASALMVTPALLLLDEPTVGADQRSIDVILELLLHLKNMGCGIVLVTHSYDEMRSVSDRVITLEKGVITGEETL